MIQRFVEVKYVFHTYSEEVLALSGVFLELLSIRKHVLLLVLLNEVHELKFGVGEVHFGPHFLVCVVA